MLLIHYGAPFDLNKFVPVTDSGYSNKPLGGLWTSPFNSNKGWKQFCGIESTEHSTTLKFKGRIFTINSLEDLDKLSWIKITYSVIPVFKDVIKEYDAIHLTAKGEKETKYGKTVRSPNLYGWDCETVFIINPYSLTLV